MGIQYRGYKNIEAILWKRQHDFVQLCDNSSIIYLYFALIGLEVPWSGTALSRRVEGWGEEIILAPGEGASTWIRTLQMKIVRLPRPKIVSTASAFLFGVILSSVLTADDSSGLLSGSAVVYQIPTRTTALHRQSQVNRRGLECDQWQKKGLRLPAFGAKRRIASSIQLRVASAAAEKCNNMDEEEVESILWRQKPTAESWEDRYERLKKWMRTLGYLEQNGGLRNRTVVHVAGTKGKGSTCTMVESIGRHAGLSTGLFTSPHLVYTRERIRINGRAISSEVFVNSFEKIWARCLEVVQHHQHQVAGEHGEHVEQIQLLPSTFELLFLIAVDVFAQEKIDHQKLLGDTIGKIAKEKAGIFKHGVPAFTIEQPHEARDVLIEAAREANTTLQLARHLHPPPFLSLSGDHQYYNARLAAELFNAFEQQQNHHVSEQRQSLPSNQGRSSTLGSMNIDTKGSALVPNQQEAKQGDGDFSWNMDNKSYYYEGLARAKWPGRAQMLTVTSLPRLQFFLDGAHTPESIYACGKWFAQKQLVSVPDNLEEDPRKEEEEEEGGESKKKTTMTTTRQELGRRNLPILIFNCTGNRDASQLLTALTNGIRAGSSKQLARSAPSGDADHQPLVVSTCDDDGNNNDNGLGDLLQYFKAVSIVPARLDGEINSTSSSSLPDVIPAPLKAARDEGRCISLGSFEEALAWITEHLDQSADSMQVDSHGPSPADPQAMIPVLITGSLYLVGNALKTFNFDTRHISE
eukprot:jgi/Bigna1/73504/fgenesh1_pg.24_\